MTAENRDYRKFYEKLTAPLAGHPERVRAMRLIGRILTGIMYAAYPALLLWLGMTGSPQLLQSILVPGISFLILSLVRRLINRPRPYVQWKIHPLMSKKATGESMPSRHVFSTAVIAMVWLRFFPAAGICFLVFGAVNAVIRVLGGVHYPSDVVAGYAAGVAAGLLMFV